MKLHVENMTCGHCEKAIKQAIASADQNAQVAVDLNAKQVDVETTLSLEQVQGVLKEEGYTATVI